MDEISRLKQKILELENIKKQKEMEEEDAKKETFEYYFQELFHFIQMKRKKEISKNTFQTFCSSEDQRVKKAIEENKELLHVLENIYNSLDKINKRLLKLENN